MKLDKNNIIVLIIAIVLSNILNVIAENIVLSNSVSYSNSKTSEVTVEGALDDLFDAVDINNRLGTKDITSIGSTVTDAIVNLEKIIDEKVASTISDTLNKTYPVGSIYISVANTNPSTLFGGTWERFATGRTLVGTDGTSEATGGNSTATLTVSNLPSHSHSVPPLSGTAIGGNHRHTNIFDVFNGYGDSNYEEAGVTAGTDYYFYYNGAYYTGFSGDLSMTVTTNASNTGNTGSGNSFSIQDPYITVYMWKRTK